MIHVRVSQPNSVVILENKGTPTSLFTYFNEPIVNGSLCINTINQELYQLRNNSWALIGGDTNGSSGSVNNNTYAEMLRASINLNGLHIMLSHNVENTSVLIGSFDSRFILTYALNLPYRKAIVGSIPPTINSSIKDTTEKISFFAGTKVKTFLVTESYADCRRFYSKVGYNNGATVFNEVDTGSDYYNKTYSELSSLVDKGVDSITEMYIDGGGEVYALTKYSAFIPSTSKFIIESMWIEYNSGTHTSVLKMSLVKKTALDLNLSEYSSDSDYKIVFYGDPDSLGI